MYEGKDLDTAEAHLRAFIADPPGDEWRGWAHERLGDLYQKRKQPDMALVFWKRTLRDSPDDEAVRKKIERARKKGAVPAKGVPRSPPSRSPRPSGLPGVSSEVVWRRECRRQASRTSRWASR
jgi:hypothetical protein